MSIFLIEKINKPPKKSPTQPRKPNSQTRPLVLKNLICKSNNFVPLGRGKGPGGGEEWGGEAGERVGGIFRKSGVECGGRERV